MLTLLIDSQAASPSVRPPLCVPLCVAARDPAAWYTKGIGAVYELINSVCTRYGVNDQCTKLRGHTEERIKQFIVPRVPHAMRTIFVAIAKFLERLVSVLTIPMHVDLVIKGFVLGFYGTSDKCVVKLVKDGFKNI